ncbi:hypothetical protein GZ77_07030 [Endozoicomonas montiporae]|uniref:Proteophosphoglycan n=1 Tax=Endozoicomonas montiporae TaxID=1027273 RepID=A0A081N6W2_9GAMM|nr:hypothetical protein GZ77_07030 [Endozoicomonas montiporae]
MAVTLQSLETKGLPPVNDWHPDFCGDIDMRICSDGHWEYMGSPIGRESMVRLFSTVLRHDDDGHFYLVTPVEKVRIRVDDAPFIAVSVEQISHQHVFTTNVGDKVILNPQHPLRLSDEGAGVPYILVRDRLEARIHRNVYYELVNRAELRMLDGQEQLCITSGDHYYSLGMILEQD